MRNVSHNHCGENQDTHFTLSSLFFGKSCRYAVEPDRPQTTIQHGAGAGVLDADGYTHGTQNM
jgi:hypothetical protein